MTAFSKNKMTRFAAIMLISLWPSLSAAWSGGGHSIIAYIAESHLSAQARRGVQDLLKEENLNSIEQVANWADAMRSLKVPQQPSHALRLPLDGSPYDRKRDCGNNMCATWAIQAAINCLADAKATSEAKITALKYLVHLTGDIHQPLHASKDTGQRKVLFAGEQLSLHQVWDGGITRSLKIGNRKLAGMVDLQIPDSTVDLDPIHWAYESRDIARDEIYPELQGLPTQNGATVLPADYAERHWPTVEKRLKLAGLRLAGVLNAIYSGNASLVSQGPSPEDTEE
ncbi:S1/P1 nuclease [Neorhizobium sp. NCHU2750]|uniref:S1/P1 nuclease n=1 Tax=Neorhizobium sp. NCHU2750 TaxID=1825976 RepID=UPI000E71F451|nr:hypothetical protein NCHU2750_01790 [Neorhizobium sp. NCHU2750]